MSIKAMKQALEALEEVNSWESATRWNGCFDEEITSLRQAIAEAEKQEPFGFFQYDMRLDAWVQNRNSNKGAAFYTHPQPKREPLTDEQIEVIAKENEVWRLFRSLAIFDFVKAIEAAHGIKE